MSANALDTLYLILITGFIILVVFFSYAAYQIAKTMKSARLLIEDVEDLAKDVSQFKNTMKVGVAGILLSLLNLFIRRR